MIKPYYKQLKVSIITVTLNSSDFLKDCLKSIKSQTYNNIEHIIVDGGSTDKTLSILEESKNEISIIVSSKDKGIYDAMNKGIQLATGDIIGFLNSDDFYANNDVIFKVVKQFEYDQLLQTCYADLVYVERFNTSKNIRYVKSGEFKHGLFLTGWCPPHPTFFALKSVYNRFGSFNLSYRFASDFDLMLRFLEKHKLKSLYISEVLVNMRLGGVTNKNIKNIWLQNREILTSFKENGLRINIVKFFFLKIVSRLVQFFNSKL